jgi:alkylhydroperoxidase family enzyme
LRISRHGGARRRVTPAFAANKRQVSPAEDNAWESLHPDIPPSSPSPLPTDEQLGAKTVAKLKLANDLNVACMLAGTGDMLDGGTGLFQAVFQARDTDPKMRELIILRSAYLLDCPYEWQTNVVMAKNTGCTQEQIDAMASEGPLTGLDNKTALVVLASDEITEAGGHPHRRHVAAAARHM